MDHLKNENDLVSEQKVLFDRSWKLQLLRAHSGGEGRGGEGRGGEGEGGREGGARTASYTL